MVIFVIHIFLSILFIYFFFREKKLGFKLPSPGDYATGIFFIDTDLNKVMIYFMESKVVFLNVGLLNLNWNILCW